MINDLKSMNIKEKILWFLCGLIGLIAITGLIYVIIKTGFDVIAEKNKINEKFQKNNIELISTKNTESLSNNFKGPYITKLPDNSIDEIYVYFNINTDDFHIYTKNNRDQFTEVFIN